MNEDKEEKQMNTPEREDRDENAENPAAAHGYTLAQLVEEKAQRQRDQAAAVFGLDPNQPDQNEEQE